MPSLSLEKDVLIRYPFHEKRPIVRGLSSYETICMDYEHRGSSNLLMMMNSAFLSAARNITLYDLGHQATDLVIPANHQKLGRANIVTRLVSPHRSSERVKHTAAQAIR